MIDIKCLKTRGFLANKKYAGKENCTNFFSLFKHFVFFYKQIKKSAWKVFLSNKKIGVEGFL